MIRSRRAFLAMTATVTLEDLVGCSCEPVVTVYLVRHAEKAKAGGKDPELSEAGKARAEGLIKALEGVTLEAVYATQFKRTQQTVAPTAKAKGLSVETISADDTPKLLAKLRSHAGQAVLVAGHSNTIPDIAKQLGVAEPPTFAEQDYGDLLVVTVRGPKATMDRKRFEA